MRIRLKNVLRLRDQKKLNCIAHTVIWLNKFCPYWPWTDGWILRFAGKPLPVCKRNHRANTRFLQRFLMDQIIPDSIRWFRKAKQHGWLENNREMAWKNGIDCIDVSTGGLLDKKPNIPVRPGYQVPYTTAMKEAISIPVSAVGLLDNPGLCEHILQTNQADLILQGRALIRNVNWLADAAEELRDTNFEVYNHSYQRGQRKR